MISVLAIYPLDKTDYLLKVKRGILFNLGKEEDLFICTLREIPGVCLFYFFLSLCKRLSSKKAVDIFSLSGG
ncbi:MAG: hypothetical protein PHH97_07845 [Candidatus Cloacimonetes bacterium]|nr:hypothetical protein [Candidatus Cloacimonadota bacterium]